MSKKIYRGGNSIYLWLLLFIINAVFVACGTFEGESSTCPWPKKRSNINDDTSIAQRVKMRRVEQMTNDEVQRYHGCSSSLNADSTAPIEMADLLYADNSLDTMQMEMMDLLYEGEGQQLLMTTDQVNEQMRQRSSSRVQGLDWDWQSAIDHMHSDVTTLWNPIGDGNCLYWALLESTNEGCTMSNVISLRREINEYILYHQDDYVSHFLLSRALL